MDHHQHNIIWLRSMKKTLVAVETYVHTDSDKFHVDDGKGGWPASAVCGRKVDAMLLRPRLRPLQTCSAGQQTCKTYNTQHAQKDWENEKTRFRPMRAERLGHKMPRTDWHHLVCTQRGGFMLDLDGAALHGCPYYPLSPAATSLLGPTCAQAQAQQASLGPCHCRQHPAPTSTRGEVQAGGGWWVCGPISNKGRQREHGFTMYIGSVGTNGLVPMLPPPAAIIDDTKPCQPSTSRLPAVHRCTTPTAVNG